MIHEILPSSTKFYNPHFYSLTVIASNMCVWAIYERKHGPQI